MTVSLALPSWSRRIRGPQLVAALLVAAGVVLLVVESSIRDIEAHFSAFLMSLTGVAHAHPMGYSVIFPQGHQWIGYSITAGCTATLLAVPFFFISAALLLTRRVSVGRGFLGLVVVVALVWLVNQLRLFLIGASMRLWGFQTGYNRSHVLAGGVLSTLGVAIGLAIFLGLIVRDRRTTAGPDLPTGGPA
ncbi:MAG: hypothetical protein ACLPVF_04870 [Acidimicrobiales bacterium]